MNDERRYQEEVNEAPERPDFFKVMEGNDWMVEASTIPMRRKLAGDLWYEGENAVLFADSNSGKSVLAVQIADAISRGDAVGPLELTAQAQKVLYFDFEMDSPQFYHRYSINGQSPYKWNANLLRVEISEDAEFPHGNFTQFICDQIERVMLYFDAKIGIIDNISYLNDQLDKGKEATPLIKMLKAIKRKHGFSFLILAHMPKRMGSKPITKNDLSGSKQIINLVDSAFAIGDSRKQTDLHYIKQVKSRNAKYAYDKDNVLVCRLIKTENFLGFEFMETDLELNHIEAADPMSRERLIERIKRDIPQGKSARSIAEETGFSHTTVNRLIKNLVESGELKDGRNGTVPDVTHIP